MVWTASEPALLAEYGHVCEQFKELTEIRFKLLAFLPLGTIGTLGILQSQKDVWGLAAPLAVFGFFVTVAIFVYSLRNDQHYDELVGRAAQIERELKLFDGSFAQRPVVSRVVATSVEPTIPASCSRRTAARPASWSGAF